jgi:hypothetical protein
MQNHPAYAELPCSVVGTVYGSDSEYADLVVLDGDMV